VILAKAQKMRKEYLSKFGYNPSNDEIAAALGISPTTLTNVETAHVNVISIDAEVKSKTTGQTQTKTRSVVETIEDEHVSAEQLLINQELRQILLDSLRLLTPREEKILRLRFGLYTADDDVENFPMTLTQLIELQTEEN